MYRLSPVCISDRTSELLACFTFENKNPTLPKNRIGQNVWEVQNYICHRYLFIHMSHLEKNCGSFIYLEVYGGFSEENYR